MTSFLKGGAVAAALLGTTMIAGVANAAPTLSFTPGFGPGTYSPTTGFTPVDTFDDLSGLTINSNPALVQIKTPPSDGNGAPPANSVPAGTAYLSVLGGGSATYTFATPVSAFQFDWGSIDSYNTLTVNYAGGSIDFVPGGNFPNAATGNQFVGGTNGLATVFGAPGELITSVTFASSANSFEVDNLAVRAVPEPATWAMMIGGFGAVGFGMRRSKAKVRAAKAFA